MAQFEYKPAPEDKNLSPSQTTRTSPGIKQTPPVGKQMEGKTDNISAKWHLVSLEDNLEEDMEMSY